jgi:hypothetical protein
MQLFPRTLNYLPLVAAIAAVGGGTSATFALWYWGSPKFLQVGYAPEQPIPYSHQLHAGELGIDCRYCHVSVERSQEANIPPTQTCMGCHAIVKPDSPRLEALRESWASGEPVPWVRVHKVPEHAYFDHSVHVTAGVGCVSCHGRIDQMEVVSIAEPISMGFCLECHRDPQSRMVPPTQVTNLGWQPGDGDDELIAHVSSLQPPQHCSGCHR